MRGELLGSVKVAAESGCLRYSAGVTTHSAGSVQASRPTRVLIIDDDRKLCALITEYLGPLGFEVAAEHTGPAGVEHAITGNADVVILDVMLPGLDGFEVLKRIRQKSQVPVLMLTARGERRTGSSGWKLAQMITCRRRFRRVNFWRGCEP